ncbi:MAG: diacylglycerol kinase family protein [Bacteroidetes bacterium]|jgi:diacylglycerol kinase (ATP)|nr:diacylglycerol kinase family protein [Bacteroidota bacterium]
MAKFSLQKRGLSFKYAFKGIWLAIRSQHNMWIHLIIATTVIIAGIYFCLSATEWIIITMLITVVLALEIMNTAIEVFIDWLSPDENTNAGKVKDLAAGAVLIGAIGAAIIGIVIFLPKIMALF